jgi:hypothetical protein
MTIDLEKTTADGRRAIRTARRQASKVVDQARSVDLPSLSDLGPTLSDLGHRFDQVPAELEKAVDRQVRAAKHTGRVARRKARAAKRSGLTHAVPNRSRRRSVWRVTGILLGLGACVAVVLVTTRKRRAADASETRDPFGTAVREAEEARRAATSSVRA